jgi:hypothetical protein
VKLVISHQGSTSLTEIPLAGKRLPIGGWYMRDPRIVGLFYELPEVASLALKLSSRMPLGEGDERVLLELAQASG